MRKTFARDARAGDRDRIFGSIWWFARHAGDARGGLSFSPPSAQVKAVSWVGYRCLRQVYFPCLEIAARLYLMRGPGALNCPDRRSIYYLGYLNKVRDLKFSYEDHSPQPTIF